MLPQRFEAASSVNISIYGIQSHVKIDSFGDDGGNRKLGGSLESSSEEMDGGKVVKKEKWMVGSGVVWMVCLLLMLTTSRGSLGEAPDWSESLSVMTEEADGRKASGRGIYKYIYTHIFKNKSRNIAN